MKKLALWWLFGANLLVFAPAHAQDVLIAAKKDGKWGYLNTNGGFAITPRFTEASAFFNGLAVVSEGGEYGVIDSKGRWVFALRKSRIHAEINSNRITLSSDLGKWGAMDIKGKTHIPFEYDALAGFQNGWVLAGKKTSAPDIMRLMVLDTLGSNVIAFDNIYLPSKLFDEGKKVREGYVSILVDGEFKDQLIASEYKLEGRPLYFAMLDVKRKSLINARINSLSQEVREGRLNLSIEGISYSWSVPLSTEIALSDAKFSFLSPAIYPFSGGIAAVHKNGKWAFVDKDGSLVSETNLPADQYTNTNPLYFGGFVIFKKTNGTEIFTDLNGNQKIALEFEALQPFQYGLAVAKLKGKYGLLQKDGSWAVAPEFDDLKF